MKHILLPLFLLAALFLSACAAPVPTRGGILSDHHGKLVQSTFTPVSGHWSNSLFWDKRQHECSYEDGITLVVAGTDPCPI